MNDSRSKAGDSFTTETLGEGFAFFCWWRHAWTRVICVPEIDCDPLGTCYAVWNRMQGRRTS